MQVQRAIFVLYLVGILITWIITIYSLRSTKKTVTSISTVAELKVKLNYPEGWRKIDVNNKFSFYLPSDMKQEEEMGYPEYAGPHKSLANRNLHVGYEYIETRNRKKVWYGPSCELLMGKISNDSGSPISDVEVGGKKAMQITGQYKSKLFKTLCFPDIGNETLLTFGVNYPEDLAVDAEKIIGSIEFP